MSVSSKSDNDTYSSCSGSTTDTEPETKHFQEPGRNLHGKEDETQAKLVCCVLVCVNLILLGLVVLLSIFIHMERGTPVPVKRFCVPRSHIDIHPYDRRSVSSCNDTHDIHPYDRRSVSSCNDTHCCFHNLNASAQILQNMTRRWLKEKLAYDNKRKYERYECEGDKNSSNIERAIKNTIKLVARDKRSAPCENIVWNCSSEREIVPSSNPYYRAHKDTGFIEILDQGLYYVYTQVNIHYSTDSLTTRSTAPDDYYHMVISTQNTADTKNEQILMTSKNSQCACNNDTQLFSSYLGSDILLSKGDNLAVRVYDKTVIQMPRESNFFGILKV